MNIKVAWLHLKFNDEDTIWQEIGDIKLNAVNVMNGNNSLKLGLFNT